MKISNIFDAVNMFGWKVYQLNFIDGTSERIASFIDADPTEEAFSVHMCKKNIPRVYIYDEVNNFSYEKYFGKKFDGLIKDVTEEYTV